MDRRPPVARRRWRRAVAAAAVLGTVVAFVLAFEAQLRTEGRWPDGAVSAQEARPFGLPFSTPPGFSTWFISQSFGNTTYAHAERAGLYASGQGLHMGLDLAAACGTPVVSIGDGTVLSVDGRGGSPPHNLMIDHGNGFVSFYGHLLERPSVSIGQRISRGDPVALTGDMLGNCAGSPHLHLELRDSSLTSLYNPVTLIDADWHSIALLSQRPIVYQRDLDDPRRWQSLDDQPPISLGGPLLNDFTHTWPVAGD